MAQLNVYEWGSPDGAPVVCLHGVTGHGRRFEALAARLAGFRVVAFDLRGHSGSTWEAPWDVETHVADLLETAASLGVSSAAWVGHSFGGRLVAELARRHPEAVGRAVLLDPAMHIAPAEATARAEGVCADTTYGSPAEAIEARLGDGSLFTTPRATLEEEAAQHLEQGSDGRWRWRYSPPAVVAAWSTMAGSPPAFAEVPTLVVLGERSWIPVDVPHLPHVRVVRVPGGHSVLWDDFDATADAVAEFLAER